MPRIDMILLDLIESVKDAERKLLLDEVIDSK